MNIKQIVEKHLGPISWKPALPSLVAELEREIAEKSYNSGYDNGDVAGFHRGYEAGHDDGWKQAYTEVHIGHLEQIRVDALRVDALRKSVNLVEQLKTYRKDLVLIDVFWDLYFTVVPAPCHLPRCDL